MDIKPIHRIFASLIHNKRWTIEDIPEVDREATQHVLDTEYTN